MAIKTISQFDAATPTSNDKILFEQNGEGKSTTVENLGKSIGINKELLWENSSPISEFSPQKISLDLTNYKFIIISFTIGEKDSSSSYYGSHIDCLFLKSDKSSFTTAINKSNILSNRKIYREIRSITDTGIVFGNGKLDDIDGSYTNDAIIPYKIYGVK